MAKPTLVVVDDEDASRQALAQELEARYGAHYRIVASASPEEGLTALERLRGEGADVPLVMADQWMPGRTGTQFLARVRELYPTARRLLLIPWGDQAAYAAFVAGAALGQIDFFLVRPRWSPDEHFHLTITESLEEWWSQRGGWYAAVTVIGAERSPRVHEIRDLLTRNSVPFGFHRADSAEGRAALRRLGMDRSAGPVVALFNGAVLADPTNTEVAEALGVNIRPPEAAYDVVIVGAGPAGLAAAVYGASEGLSTAMLEREAVGGQAGTSSLIRNYLGFPRGVSGVELASRAFNQAWMFGTHYVYGNPATSLARDGDLHVVGLQDGSSVTCRAVIIATGVSYRRLAVPELESLVGAGVFYGAGTAEAQAVAGNRVFVVGGGNSAGQAALHLARYAQQVTVLVRSTSLAASMSEYLVREIEVAPNIEVRYRTEVVGGAGDGHLERLDLRHRDTGKTESAPAGGLFVLIGGQPFTQWLPEAVGRDRWGFILTGPGLAGWAPARAPFLLETSAPGVFAAGDVRHGSVKRVASAVGDGSIAIRLVHEYLALARAERAGDVGRDGPQPIRQA
jgi:thioredoxin reductase (NADPH)